VHSIHLALRITVESEAAQEPQDSKHADATAQGSLFESDNHSIGNARGYDCRHSSEFRRLRLAEPSFEVIMRLWLRLGVQIVGPSNLKGVA
jgi:hypothetical protein